MSLQKKNIVPVSEDNSSSDYMEERVYRSLMGCREDEILASGGFSGTTLLFMKVHGLIYFLYFVKYICVLQVHFLWYLETLVQLGHC